QGYGDDLARRAAGMAIVNLDVVFLGQRLTGGQEVERVVSNREAPPDGVADIAQRAEGKAAEVTARLGREARRVRIERVDIGDGDRARVPIRRGAAGEPVLLDDPAAPDSPTLALHDALPICQGYGDDLARRAAGMAIVNLDVVFLGQRL